jgi:NAD(P)-dependent dehydrogenase (short-subunit alcohol dehydrogenase family)
MAKDKVAVVTAAGHGMGAAIARELAATGYSVSLMSVSGASLELAAELGGIGMSGSVTSPADLANLVQLTTDTFGRIDAVVNNTGHPAKGPLLDIPDEDWHAGLDLVVLNVVRMARLVTPLMQATGGGAMVNVSTFAAYEPDPGFPISASLRAALGSFTKLYADTYAADGIRMNNVLPGFIESYPVDEETVARIPMGRPGTVEEIAKTTAFLLSPGAAYLTGQNIRIDGGITRSV